MNRLKKIFEASEHSDHPQACLVSILSGKGGVGKSVIAFNLAERAAAAGSKTLLVDADFYCGNLHILANVDPGEGLEAYLGRNKSLVEATTTYNENLDILSRSETGPLNSLNSVTEVAQWAARLREDASGYDLVILDHSSGISETATVLASASDVNLLVLVPELTSISDCYGLCKYLYQANQQLDCRLLLNRIDSEDEAEYLWTKFAATAEQFLGKVPGLAGSLPEDETVCRSVATQRPLSEISAQSPVAQALAALIGNLGGETKPVTAGHPNTTINNEAALAEIRE